jgi:hypothetical protein
MAVTYVASVTETPQIDPLSGDWTLPVGWADGDKAFFWWYVPGTGGTKTVTAGAGVTEKVNAFNAGGTLFVGWRDLESGDTTFGWTSSSLGSADTIWGVDVFRGLPAGDPFIGTVVPTYTSPQDNPDPPAVTPLVDDSLVWTIFGKNENLDSWPPTPPSGYTLAGGATTFLGFDATAATAYKIVSGGASVSEDPGAWTVAVSAGSSNTMLTLAAAPEPLTISGSAVFGVDGTVTATRAVLFSLDGETNVHSDAGVLKICGDLEVTGDTTFEGAVSVTDPGTVMHSIVTTGSDIVYDSDGNIVVVDS